MNVANAYLRDVYLPAFNTEFTHPSREDDSSFVPRPPSVVLDDILCEQFERAVSKDNCVSVIGAIQCEDKSGHFNLLQSRTNLFVDNMGKFGLVSATCFC